MTDKSFQFDIDKPDSTIRISDDKSNTGRDIRDALMSDVLAELEKELQGKADTAANAKHIAKEITQDEELGSNPYQRQKIAEMFADAAAKGPHALQQLTDAVNDELKQAGSDFRIHTKHGTHDEIINDHPKPGNLMHDVAIYRSPSVRQFSDAVVALTKGDSFEPQDVIQAKAATHGLAARAYHPAPIYESLQTKAPDPLVQLGFPENPLAG